MHIKFVYYIPNLQSCFFDKVLPSCFSLKQTIYVTGFAKRGLPYTSNFMNLEDHNFVIKRHMKLKVLQLLSNVGTSISSP